MSSIRASRALSMQPRGLLGGVLVASLVIGSCGSDPTADARTASAAAPGAASEATLATAPNAPATGEATSVAETTSAPGSSGSTDFQFQLPEEVVAELLQRAEQETGRQMDPPTAQPGTTHRLERVIIDRNPPSEEPSFDWDQEAALACAHVEFALDALIAQDKKALNRTLRAAAEWARDSGATEITNVVRDLRRTTDFAEAEVLVFDVLGACAEAGYEL